MSNLFKVSQSKVKRWRECRFAYKSKYIDGLRRRVTSRPFKFGTIIHEMVEADANNQDPFKKLDEISRSQRKLFLAERELYGDIVADARYIMEAYFEYYARDPIVYLKINGQYAEHEFEVDLCDGILLKGKIDGIAKHKGLKALVEHKSGKNMPNDDDRWRNVQSCVYVWASPRAGLPELDGTCWDFIRSKPPTRPQMKKDGELSERQLDSLPQVVIDTIKANKLNPKNYRDLISSQTKGLSSWFRRVYTPIKPKVSLSIMKDFIQTAREMADYSHKSYPRTIGRHCSWCEFEPLCRAELQGLDVEFAKKREYVHEEAKEDEDIGSDPND